MENLSTGIRLTKATIARAIDEYPATFVLPDDTVFQALAVIEVEGSNPRRFSVNIDLWSKEEGRSDLTLAIQAIESDGELMNVEIDDIRVL